MLPGLTHLGWGGTARKDGAYEPGAVGHKQPNTTLVDQNRLNGWGVEDPLPQRPAQGAEGSRVGNDCQNSVVKLSVWGYKHSSDPNSRKSKENGRMCGLQLHCAKHSSQMGTCPLQDTRLNMSGPKLLSILQVAGQVILRTSLSLVALSQPITNQSSTPKSAVSLSSN